MKKLILVILVIFCFNAISCDEVKKEVSKEDAIEYNNFLVTSIDPVVTKMLDFEEAIYEEDKEKIKLLHADLVSLTAETRKKITEKPPFDDNESFKNSLLEIIDYYKSVAENDYNLIIKMIEDENELSEEEFDKIEDIISNMYDKENEYYNNFEKEVNTYAKKYSIEINELNEFY